MSGETKQRLSDLEVENAELRQHLLGRPTLRDQFAMSAMTGLLSNPSIDQLTPNKFAVDSYLIADKMMGARHAKD